MESYVERFSDYLDRFRFLESFQVAHRLHATGNDEIEYREGGALAVTSGQLIACDPYYCDHSAPFEETVPPGRYPIALAILHTGNADERVALAGLRLREDSPVRWALARLEGEDGEDRQCYGVDSGTGCFLDADAVPWLTEQVEDDPTYLEDQMRYVPTWGVVSAGRHEDAAKVVAFSSGWGDGVYCSYWGYDASGAVVCLVTDFGVLDEVRE